MVDKATPHEGIKHAAPDGPHQASTLSPQPYLRLPLSLSFHPDLLHLTYTYMYRHTYFTHIYTHTNTHANINTYTPIYTFAQIISR